MRYYALQHGHFSDPYSVRVALDGTAEPRYKDQGSGTCVERGGCCGWVARPRVGGTGPTRAAPPTGPYERNRAERNQRATARRNANGSPEPSRVAPARAPRAARRQSNIEYRPCIAKSAKVRSRNTASRAAAGCIPERSAVFALRLRCARCACGLYVLRTPLPPSPVYSMPNIEHAMPAGAFVESCVSASARRSSVGG